MHKVITFVNSVYFEYKRKIEYILVIPYIFRVTYLTFNSIKVEL